MISSTTSSSTEKSSAFASVYLLASIIYCNLFCGGISGAHVAFWKNSGAKAGPKVASIDSSLVGCRRSVRTTANVARVEELICSHDVAPSSVLRFH